MANEQHPLMGREHHQDVDRDQKRHLRDVGNRGVDELRKERHREDHRLRVRERNHDRLHEERAAALLSRNRCITKASR